MSEANTEMVSVFVMGSENKQISVPKGTTYRQVLTQLSIPITENTKISTYPATAGITLDTPIEADVSFSVLSTKTAGAISTK